MKKSILLLFTGSLLATSSCSSSRDGAHENGNEANEAMLHSFEAEFDPSEYNDPLETVLKKRTMQHAAPEEISVRESTEPPADLIQGFRVQIFASTSIDEASKEKSVAEELFPEEWFYLVYDPPTYKVRGGNFTSRFEADLLLRELKTQGFRDSWIVPDRVVKDSPTRGIPPIEPENGR